MMPTQQEQSAAFEEYANRRRKADASLSIDDGRLAAEAWIIFLNLYLPDHQKMPVRRRADNVAIFPFHRISSPGRF
ncbi:hypothetical protein [Rhizobium tubonense]|uniref:Uncharacterized protein n=1 Tax=Rhizobium tubonense TaxID=484088 RepID=A0A2W4E6Y7_9HYPH|nr:hypothetical protein [Rhizobium tubonense]PZM07600.1 hypothetical protein CPY51_31215 [Rhizobium tubonense]